MVVIDGKKISQEVQAEIAEEVKKITSSGKKVPHLAAILVGHDGASETYVNAKVKACDRVGFQSALIKLPDSISERELLEKINALNHDDTIDGFIVQLPLPKHIAEKKIIEAISPLKDVDGFHPVNVGKMTLNLPSYLPATPYGIIQLIKRYNIPTEGKHCVVVGRSNIVGSPISILMGRNTYPGNCTVTIAHSKTTNLKEVCRSADILISAIGKPEFLTAEYVKQGAVVIDVGITRVPSTATKSGWKLLGDVKYNEVAPICSYITPVPGGVGPMTITSLLMNTLKASKKEIHFD